MGNFGGHAVPGIFFLWFGLWWLFKIIKMHSSCRPQFFRSSVTYPPRFKLFARFDLEGLFLAMCTASGFLLETVGAKYGQWHNIATSNLQHSTMYYFFMVLGLLSCFKQQLEPYFPNIESIRYIALILAFAVEGLLFQFHTFGMNEMETLLHTLLVYSIMGCVAGCVLEMLYPDILLCALMRPACAILQGTWFWQLGFILWNPFNKHSTWDPKNHAHLMLLTCYFTWHIGVITTVIFGCFLVISFKRGHCEKSSNGLISSNAQNIKYSVLDTEEEISLLDCSDTVVDGEPIPFGSDDTNTFQSHTSPS